MFSMIPLSRERLAVAPDFAAMRREVARIFHDFYHEDGAAPAGSMWPAFELSETKESFVLKAEVPGMSATDVEIQVEGDFLSLSGESKQTVASEGEDVHFSERRYGAWRRAFRLPATADAARIDAQVKDGILTLAIPKRAEARPKVVKVKGG